MADRKRIWVDENIPAANAIFSPLGDVTLFHGRRLKSSDLETADALIVRSITRVDAGLLDSTPVGFVGTATIGEDHIDREYLRRSSIAFTSAPGCNANSVAEYIAACLLRLRVEKGVRLRGRVFGLIGYGNVGRRVKPMVEALGLQVRVCDPILAEGGKLPVPHIALDELVPQCDVISLHVPLTRSGPHPTLNMLHGSLMKNFRSSVILLNTSRGETVDEDALFDACAKGRIAHLVSDVFSGEPRPDSRWLRWADWITPHIAGYSLNGKIQGGLQVAAGLAEHFDLPFEARSGDFLQRQIFSGSAVPDDEDGLWSVVRRICPLERDDLGLREAMISKNVAEGFDSLRKNYPERHEFGDYDLPWKPKGPMEGVMRSLGFALSAL